MRISELADRVGVPTSTVRYYERVGLMATPDRTASGYRDYDDDAAARLLFVARARKLGLACEQIAELTAFASQLESVRAELAASPPPPACRTDLSCCVPETEGVGPIAVELVRRRVDR